MAQVPHRQRSRRSHGRAVRPSHSHTGYLPGMLGYEEVYEQIGVDGDVQPGGIPPGTVDGDGALIPGSLSLTPFASTIRPVGIVGTLPTLPDPAYPVGALVFLTTDGKVYRNVAGAWTKAVDGTDIIADSITAGQIAAGAIGASEIAVGAVSAEKIAADTITAGQIAAGAIGASEIAAGVVSAVHIAVGAVTADKFSTLGGGNMLSNPSFENGVLDVPGDVYGWPTVSSPEARIHQFSGSLGDTTPHGLRVAEIISDGTEFPLIRSGKIPVKPGSTYRLSAWLRPSVNASTGMLQLRSYDKNSGGEIVQVRASTSVLDTWAKLTGTYTVLKTGDATQAQFVEALCSLDGAYPAGTQLLIDAVELIEVSDQMRNAPGNVLIDSTGITINNGKLVLQDEFGKATLGSLGFSGPWDDYVALGLYNARFLSGTVGALPTGRTASLPYWDVREAGWSLLAGGGVQANWSALGSIWLQAERVPVHPGMLFNLNFVYTANRLAGTIAPRAWVVWVDKDNVVLEQELGPYINLTTSVGSPTWMHYPPMRAPATAAYARVYVEASETDAHSTANFLRFFGIHLRPLQSGPVGLQMRGLPYGFNPNVAHATALDLALSTGSLVGGMLAVPISISSSMALRSYSLWNTDTASLRTASARLYVQDHDNPAVALTVADSLGNWSFTPTAASGRESSEVGIFLAPGTYWLAIVNSSTAQTFGIGRTVAPPDFAQMAGQFHALLSLSATSIDLNAGWTRFGNGPAVALNPYAPGSVGAF